MCVYVYIYTHFSELNETDFHRKKQKLSFNIITENTNSGNVRHYKGKNEKNIDTKS